MPLPDDGTNQAWPPPQLGQISPKLAEWSAWYSGDVDQLANHYRTGHVPTDLKPAVRSVQYAGGLVGRAARWFWGEPPPDGQLRTKLHMPVASDICTASADLLFAEEVTIRPRDDNATAAARLDTIIDSNHLHDVLLASADVAAGLGGIYLRGVVDKDVEPRCPISAPVHADSAVPEFRYGRLVAVTFWRVLSTESAVWLRHLERHEVVGGRGYVFHGLYRGTSSKLGQKVPLTEHPSTAGIGVNEDAAIPTGIDELDVTYVPNMRPNRRWRDDPTGSELGRSDFDSVEPAMDALDEVWTSWMRDIRLGRGRLIVPSHMLRPSAPGKPTTINLDQEVFVGLSSPPGEDAGLNSQLTHQQFNIRTAEHAETVKALLVQIFRSAGYSGQTFGIADEGNATATEVNSRDRRSETTREKKTRYWTAALETNLRVMLKLDAYHFGGGAGGAEVAVEFPSSSQPTLEQVAQSVGMLRSAQVASIETGVRMVHPEWDDPQVAEEVAKIAAERRLSTPTPVTSPQGEASRRLAAAAAGAVSLADLRPSSNGDLPPSA